MSPLRTVWFAVGLGAILLGALGVVLPLVPTTPFVLLAAFAFCRSSERYHAWLCNHRVFGPIIGNWRRHGAIDRRAKFAGVISMAGVIGLSFALNVAPGVLAAQIIILAVTAAFVISRPLPPQH